jgi:isoleucyl-tRNA synthetase
MEEIFGTTLETLTSFPGAPFFCFPPPRSWDWLTLLFVGIALLGTTYTDCLSPTSSSSSSSYTPSSRPVIPASYVTSTTGTGLVHTAPAHGVEDWEAWQAFQSSSDAPSSGDVLCAVDAEGRLNDVLDQLVAPEVADRLRGKDVLKDGTAETIRILQGNGRLISEVKVEHKYPYDWRTKKPVIFRCVFLFLSLNSPQLMCVFFL